MNFELLKKHDLIATKIRNNKDQKIKNRFRNYVGLLISIDKTGNVLAFLFAIIFFLPGLFIPIKTSNLCIYYSCKKLK